MHVTIKLLQHCDKQELMTVDCNQYFLHNCTVDNELVEIGELLLSLDVIRFSLTSRQLNHKLRSIL